MKTPPPLTYLVDEDIGGASEDSNAFKQLQAGGMSVETVVAGTTDPVWAAYAGQRGWPVLTKDKAIINRARISPNAATQSRIWDHETRLFICIGNQTMEHTVANIVRAHLRLNRFCYRRRASRAFIAKIRLLDPLVFANSRKGPIIEDYIRWEKSDTFRNPTKGVVKCQYVV